MEVDGRVKVSKLTLSKTVTEGFMKLLLILSPNLLLLPSKFVPRDKVCLTL